MPVWSFAINVHFKQFGAATDLEEPRLLWVGRRSRLEYFEGSGRPEGAKKGDITLVKAMKKLKFWSKKNKKKKKNNYYYNEHLYYQPPYCPLPAPPPPPPPTGEACQCHFCQPVEPSAPPLPPWLGEDMSGSNRVDPFASPSHPHGDQCISVSQEIVIKTASQLQPRPEQPATIGSSYQQYLATNPVYELPMAPRREKSTSGGLFGCGVGVGSFLIRCFFPCFHISEARSK